MDISFIIKILIYGMIAWFIYVRFAPVKGLRNVKSEEIQHILQETSHVLVDVREPHEFRERHLPCSINLPLSQLRQRLGEVPKDKVILLYCQGGMRSKQAARIFRKQGYANKPIFMAECHH